MSQRPRFIRAAAACLLPHTGWDIDKAIRYGEALWQRLSERGLGDPKTRGPQPQKDWYNQLPEVQRQRFDRFWKAYGHKVGKQRAAMRWLQLDPAAELAGHIIHAADKERQRAQNDPSLVRKHPQGWLTERRWEDHEPQQNDTQHHRRQRQQRLQAEAAGLRRLLQLKNDPALEQQLRTLEQKIKTHK